jgi:hypothetical protein
MFLLDSLLIDGLQFVFDKVRAVAEAEMDDEPKLREALLDAQTRLESGELSEREYVDVERDVLERLSTARRKRRGGDDEGISYRVTGADVKMTGDKDDR